MNIRDLKYIVVLAETGNMSKAADLCAVTQPTLSVQLKKLEDYLNVPLFHRGEKGDKRITPTKVGKEIILAAKKILSEAEYIRTLASRAKDPFTGKFRLGAFHTLAPYFFPKIIPSLQSALPDLKFYLYEDKSAQLAENLLNGTIDAAFLALPTGESELTEIPVFEDSFLLAVPSDHPLAKKQYVRHEEASELSLLLLEEGHCLRDQALQYCSKNGGEENREYRAGGFETLREMVRLKNGVTLAPAIAADDPRPGIVYLPFKNDPPKRLIGLCHRKANLPKILTDKILEIIHTIGIGDRV
jgi:LysR family transcriptional regulator, hydrogen peroxide-inducible genes activator